MFALLVAVVSSQAINPNAPAACSSAATAELPKLQQACGGSSMLSSLVASTNPLPGIQTIGSSSTALAQYCAPGCKSAVEAFQNAVAPACGSTPVFNGTTVAPTQYGATYAADSDIFCVQESGKYCINTVNEALVASGYNAANPNSLGDAFVKFSLDSKLACTSCAGKIVEKLNANLDAFGTYGPIINSGTSQVQKTCKGTTLSNSASVMGVGFVLAGLILVS